MRFRALPIQFLDTSMGVILKRGNVTLRIQGNGISEIVNKVLSIATSLREGVTVEELIEHFALPYKVQVSELVKELIDHKVLVPAEELDTDLFADAEEPEQIFYWHFNLTPNQVTERLNRKRYAVVGINQISQHLVHSLSSSGISGIDIIDYPLLRNNSLLQQENSSQQGLPFLKPPLDYQYWLENVNWDDIGCVIVTSDFGAIHQILEWNKLCVEQSVPFLPVVLDDMVGCIGPLVVAEETACYDCLVARENANLEDAEVRRLVQHVAYEGQAVIGFHSLMPSILAGLTALELTKFLTGLSFATVGAMIEIDFLNMHLNEQKILKVPRCPTCGVLEKMPAVSIEKPPFNPELLRGR
jgi:thiazole/oxazole-forming peptide maturase SagC family component